MLKRNLQYVFVLKSLHLLNAYIVNFTLERRYNQHLSRDYSKFAVIFINNLLVNGAYYSWLYNASLSYLFQFLAETSCWQKWFILVIWSEFFSP